MIKEVKEYLLTYREELSGWDYIMFHSVESDLYTDWGFDSFAIAVDMLNKNDVDLKEYLFDNLEEINEYISKIGWHEFEDIEIFTREYYLEKLSDKISDRFPIVMMSLYVDSILENSFYTAINLNEAKALIETYSKYIHRLILQGE